MDALYHDTALVDVYDAINGARKDFDFYLNELPSAPASILDIGCGTGTFALEMALLGHAVTGVDPAREMIAAAKRKDRLGSVEWIVGDVSDVAAERRFDTAFMTGHAIQCLLKDAEILALFRAVEARLKSGGSFWFETRNPAAQGWLRWTPEHAPPPIALGDGRSVRVVHKVIEVGDGFVTFEESYHFSDRPGTFASESTLRFLELSEIEKHAADAGLNVSATFGTWTREPLAAESPEIIVRLTASA